MSLGETRADDEKVRIAKRLLQAARRLSDQRKRRIEREKVAKLLAGIGTGGRAGRKSRPPK